LAADVIGLGTYRNLIIGGAVDVDVRTVFNLIIVISLELG
jgi:hypothetical protein